MPKLLWQGQIAEKFIEAGKTVRIPGRLCRVVIRDNGTYAFEALDYSDEMGGERWSYASGRVLEGILEALCDTFLAPSGST